MDIIFILLFSQQHDPTTSFARLKARARALCQTGQRILAKTVVPLARADNGGL